MIMLSGSCFFNTEGVRERSLSSNERFQGNLEIDTVLFNFLIQVYQAKQL